MKRFLLLVLVMGTLFSCHVQKNEEVRNAEYASLVISNDISNQKVSSFAEDEYGHIWIGTFRGLNRHNVHGYHQYFCADDSLSLPDNQIQCLLKDSHKRLWVGTVNGICRYTERDEFQHFPLESSIKKVDQIIEDASGNIYVNTISSLCRYNPETETFDAVLPVLDHTRSLINRCFISPANDLWVVNTASMRCYDVDTMELKDSVAVAGYPTYSYMDASGCIWMNSFDGLRIFDTMSDTFRKVPECLVSHPIFRKAYVTYIYPYDEHSLLINTEKHGLFYYDSNEGMVRHQNERGFPFAAPDFSIKQMFKDSHNNLWIGSVDQGYKVIYNYKERFNDNSYLRSCTDNKSVVSLDCDSKGNLWIATLKDGLFVYDSKSMEFSEVEVGHLLPLQDGNRTDVSIVFADKDDNIWLSAASHIIKCSYEGGRLKAEFSRPAFYPMAIEQDENGTVWIATASE